MAKKSRKPKTVDMKLAAATTSWSAERRVLLGLCTREISATRSIFSTSDPQELGLLHTLFADEKPQQFYVD
jgi:hypothetical protein